MPRRALGAGERQQQFKDKAIEDRQDIGWHGEDLPESRDWKWEAARE